MSQPIARAAQLMKFRPAAAATPPPVRGRVTIDLTTRRATRADKPPLPHERDEKVGMTDGNPSQRVQQGARDVKRGVLDTSRAPEADAAYRKLKQ